MRIIAGTAKGRALLGPKEPSGIRPTADRVRETLFNVLGQWMHELQVLDLFAGTGALALEALSRGASGAVLVDADRQAVALCRANAERLGFSSQVEVVASKVDQALASLGQKGRSFDLVFIDPPYAAQVSTETVGALVRNAVLAPGARVVVEHDKRELVPEKIERLSRIDERKFGDTVVTVYSLS